MNLNQKSKNYIDNQNRSWRLIIFTIFNLLLNLFSVGNNSIYLLINYVYWTVSKKLILSLEPVFETLVDNLLQYIQIVKYHQWVANHIIYKDICFSDISLICNWISTDHYTLCLESYYRLIFLKFEISKFSILYLRLDVVNSLSLTLNIELGRYLVFILMFKLINIFLSCLNI